MNNLAKCGWNTVNKLASCLIYAWALGSYGTPPACRNNAEQALKWAGINQLSGRGNAAT